jgi:hypothetical protein
MSIDVSPPKPTKLLAYWMDFERGDEGPGRVLANLKTAGMRILLEELVAAETTEPSL